MSEKFMEWLNSEIESLESTTDENNMFIHGKYSEAVRVRAMICQMDAKHKTIEKERVEEVAGEICGKYCRIPRDWTGSNEDMIKEHCEGCPLTELVR